MYLTPERVKTLGLGIDLDEFEVVDIRAAIARSTATIDTFCAVPTLPQRHSFRGGTITDEEHPWPIDEWQRPRPLQIWPWHTPVKTVTACKIVYHVSGGNESYISVQPDNILIADTGYIEISALELSQVAFADVISPYVGLANPISRTSYTYAGTGSAVVVEVVEPVDARTYQAVNQFWTDDTVVVKVNGATKAETTDYTLDRREGWVIFNENLDPDVVVTASYTHELSFDIAQAAGIIVAQELDKADLRRKGMGGLVSVRVKDVELRRAVAAKSTGTAGQQAVDIPADAAAYLTGYVFTTVR